MLYYLWIRADVCNHRFLFNPFTIATCIGRPTSVFTNCAILHAVSHAILDRGITSLLAISMASYLSMHPILLLPPIVLLNFDRKRPQRIEPGLVVYVLAHLVAVGSVIFTLLQLSSWLTGSWEFLESTYGVQLLLPDLTPNVGLWWYFFIEMFDSFRSFFLGVFWLHIASYVVPLCIRIRRQPLFVITTMLGLMAVFKPYPSISDVSLYLAFLPLYRHIFPLLRYPFVTGATVGYATVLGPAFWYLWIYAGSGNANFFYAITLVWSLGLGLIVADFIFAVLRDEWEVERPEMKGKEIRQI